MWKQKWLWFGIILPAVLAICIRVVYLRQPVPIIERDATSEISIVEDCRAGSQDVTEQIDEGRLLELLESHTRKRGGFPGVPYSREWVQIEISGWDQYGPFQVVLGDWPIYYRSGEKFYRILENDELLEEVLAMIDG